MRRGRLQWMCYYILFPLMSFSSFGDIRVLNVSYLNLWFTSQPLLFFEYIMKYFLFPNRQTPRFNHWTEDAVVRLTLTVHIVGFLQIKLIV